MFKWCLVYFFSFLYYMSLCTTKPTKWPVCPAKTQISLGLRHVKSVMAVRSMGSWGPKVSWCGQRRLWSDWADAQADLSLPWAHMSFWWFCHAAAHIWLKFCLANRIDPGQMLQSGSVAPWSGSTLFVYSSSRINEHLMFPLFRENQKSIPKFLVVKNF